MKINSLSFGLILLVLGVFPATAQNDISRFANDMLKIADQFASPAAESAAYPAGAGWFTSAKALELWEVDLSLQANVLLIPGNKKSTTIGGFELLNIRGAQQAEIPTAFGGDTDVVFEGAIFNQAFEFDAIDGLNKSAIPNPVLQVSVGLPYSTEAVFRFFPSVAIDKVEASTYGFGLKHNFNQYFFHPQPTDFQFAALLAFSNYDVKYAFTPLVIEHDIPGMSAQSEMEHIEVNANLFMLQLITSKDFRDTGWSAFAALGASNGSFDYVMGGHGELVPIVNDQLATLDNSLTDFKGDIGLTYEFNQLLFNAMFSQGKFSNLNFSLHYRL